MRKQHAMAEAVRAAPARYFPVEPGRYRLRAGLRPFGTDFGNAAADALYFQVDRDYAHYLEAKRTPCRAGGRPPLERAALVEDRPEAVDAHRAVLAWLHATLVQEWPDVLAECGEEADPAARYDGPLRRLQEDAVVVQRDDRGCDRAILVHVCFPTGWRPQRVVGRSFQEIHAPVPGFAETPAAAARMLRAMIDRGPYVRFVWTVSADDVLDHHPEEGRRLAFDAESREGWLRVERQVTVPFPDVNASLFLIRVYLYPFGSLSGEERSVLRSALLAMPETVRRYKGLALQLPHVIAALERSAESAG